MTYLLSMGRLVLLTAPTGFIERSHDSLDQFDGPISVRTIPQLQRQYLFPSNTLFQIFNKTYDFVT